jgi:hypothetical protein
MTRLFRALAAALAFVPATLALITPEQPLAQQQRLAQVRNSAPFVAPLAVPQVTPQFNDPGPQIVMPPPGNPVQQLTPLGVVPEIYLAPESDRAAGRGSHRGAKHAHRENKHRDLNKKLDICRGC